jgi:Protein of unknown function (DUF1579)
MRSRITWLVSALLLGVFAAGVAGQTPSQTPMVPPQPGPEVRKMAIWVGRFTNEGDAPAGAMGPNSPAMKTTGTDDCKWAAGGFAVLCHSTFDMAGTKGTEISILYYDPDAKLYHYHAVDSAGNVASATGSVAGDTWNFAGQGTINGQRMYSKFTMQYTSKDHAEWSMQAGSSESSMHPMMHGTETRVTSTAKPMASKPSAQ